MKPRQMFRKSRRSHVPFLSEVAAVLCALALAACQSSQGPEVPAANPAPSASTTPAMHAGVATHPSPFASKHASSAAATAGAKNFDALLARYPQDQRKRINAWFHKHASDSMTFTSNAQWQWMQQHDYPTPDDVLKASRMSEAQLRKLAATGDTKANFFYLARMLDNLAQAGGLAALPGRKRAQVRAELTASMDLALASGSAFAGYLFGDYYAALHGSDARGVGTAAGLTWVSSMGDSNGPMHNRRMAMGFPGVSGPRAAEVYFDMFAAAARVNPYFLKTRSSKGELLMPVQ